MPDPYARRQISSTIIQCTTIITDENTPCLTTVTQSAARCQQHHLEYTTSFREYKEHAAASEAIALSVPMALSNVKNLKKPEAVEERLRNVKQLVDALQGEVDGRLMHRLRFFHNNWDQGHEIRIRMQQTKLDEAKKLQRRLEVRLEDLMEEDRLRDLQKKSVAKENITPRSRCEIDPLDASSLQIDTAGKIQGYRNISFAWPIRAKRISCCSTQPQTIDYSDGLYATSGYSSVCKPRTTNSISQSRGRPNVRSSCSPSHINLPPLKKKSLSYFKLFFCLSGWLLILRGLGLFDPLAHLKLTGFLYLAMLAA
ncbi:hypothetical protein QCA50_007937 [Cerrena zonata]|uniref:Uncharacterized protein n=1 Tax=Cerrena zonata TaxID=2478898 RepID=A0AAW0G904_9APHY